MKTKLQKLVDTRRRLDDKQKAIDLLKRQEVRNIMEAIFEKLGINTKIELNYLTHSSRGVKVSYSEGSAGKYCGFEVQIDINGVTIITIVASEASERLDIFKKLMEAK